MFGFLHFKLSYCPHQRDTCTILLLTSLKHVVFFNHGSEFLILKCVVYKIVLAQGQGLISLSVSGS